MDGQDSRTAGRRRLDLGLRWVLAAVLVWAGLSKLVDPVSFYGAILEYQLPLRAEFLKFTAVVLPWMELFCGLLLVARIAPKATLFWVITLFAVFLLLVGQASYRGLDIACGCFDLRPFGLSEDGTVAQVLESLGFALFRNSVLLIMAVVLAAIAPLTRARETPSHA